MIIHSCPTLPRAGTYIVRYEICFLLMWFVDTTTFALLIGKLRLAQKLRAVFCAGKNLVVILTLHVHYQPFVILHNTFATVPPIAAAPLSSQERCLSRVVIVRSVLEK